ncbi:kelch-like protein 8 isoform X2 [Watersipora subatra]|uniref:kelch-like protein 8 isoform X2 n=1 Tax=Watersipora subatra TaxID=2589382 RepID=UPI00355B2AE4
MSGRLNARLPPNQPEQFCIPTRETAARRVDGMKSHGRRNGGGGSTGNVLETSLSSSPPDKNHFGRDTRAPPSRSTQRQFRSLLNLASSNKGSNDQLDIENFKTLDVSAKLFKDNFTALNEFRLKGEMCDLELKVGTRLFRCHRVVLSCTSRYFRSMFTSQMRESRSSSVELKDLDVTAVDSLLQFAYTGRLTITIDSAQALLHASSFLQFDLVAQACSDFMKQQLHPSNCLEIKKFAEQHGHTDLEELANSYISDHFNEMVDREEFMSMSPQYLADIIGSDELNVDSEIQVYEAVILWVKHDIEGRKQTLAPLLAKVKLPLLPASYLTQVVEADELIHADMECRDYVDEAKSYQLSLAGLTPTLRPYDRMVPRRSCSGVLFCVGGRGASGDPFRSIECYNFRDDKWFTIAEMSTRRRHVGVVCSNGKLYAIGGHDGEEHLNSCEVFDPVTNRWNCIAPMRTLRRGLAVAAMSNALYAIGGLDDTACFDTVERYDPAIDQWSPVAPMNVPRGGVGVAVLKNCIYAVGGNDGSSSLSSAERYDPILNKWVVIAPMTKRRAGAGVGVLHGRLYAVGGFDDNAPLESAEMYDSETNQWTYVTQMSSPRGGVGVAQLGAYLFAVGGHDGTNYLNSVEAYDPIKDSWRSLAEVSLCRAGAGTTSGDIRANQITPYP